MKDSQNRFLGLNTGQELPADEPKDLFDQKLPSLSPAESDPHVTLVTGQSERYVSQAAATPGPSGGGVTVRVEVMSNTMNGKPAVIDQEPVDELPLPQRSNPFYLPTPGHSARTVLADGDTGQKLHNSITDGDVIDESNTANRFDGTDSDDGKFTERTSVLNSLFGLGIRQIVGSIVAHYDSPGTVAERRARGLLPPDDHGLSDFSNANAGPLAEQDKRRSMREYVETSSDVSQDHGDGYQPLTEAVVVPPKLNRRKTMSLPYLGEVVLDQKNLYPEIIAAAQEATDTFLPVNMGATFLSAELGNVVAERALFSFDSELPAARQRTLRERLGKDDLGPWTTHQINARTATLAGRAAGMGLNDTFVIDADTLTTAQTAFTAIGDIPVIPFPVTGKSYVDGQLFADVVDGKLNRKFDTGEGVEYELDPLPLGNRAIRGRRDVPKDIVRSDGTIGETGTIILLVEDIHSKRFPKPHYIVSATPELVSAAGVESTAIWAVEAVGINHIAESRVRGTIVEPDGRSAPTRVGGLTRRNTSTSLNLPLHELNDFVTNPDAIGKKAAKASQWIMGAIGSGNGGSEIVDIEIIS